MKRLAAAAALLLLSQAGLAALPTPTPTPRPKLSGGFGRTPVAAREGEGQSLADVVRAAGSAHGRKEKPVAITNDSLVKDPRKGRLSTSQVAAPVRATPPPAKAGAAPASPAAVRPAEPGALPDTVPTAASPVADETAWRQRAHDARQRVIDLTNEIAQLDTETKQLETDFYRWDDGQYRDRVIKPAWDRKREDLETRRRQLAEAEKALADLPEEARKAGALPGWLRE
ncbi:MAG: hypothetical protein ABI592_14760 [Acidobacteriota bacterium]